MSDYTTEARVNVILNGQQPKKVLSDLQQRLKQTTDQLVKMERAADRDPKQLKRLRSEIRQLSGDMRKVETSSKMAMQTLGNLDRATPKQLRLALAALKRDLDGIQRGSAAWTAQVTRINQVEQALKRCNAEMRVMQAQESRWSRFNNWFNSWSTSIMAATAAVAAFIAAGRRAVNAFAEMDEQIANTIKYTGMSRDDVLAMNEAFKRMDTRTGRDKLNELAQEAGRLGKNTREAVQGYVEAADIINVALVDLGEGATQTIAKITNIFGVEQMLGTKQAMLSVGSAVNVLSQNCTASKPYLVNFAQRMSGIGAQARMTIPQILAFGATLDANGQKVEMSASAISRLIMMLFQKPGEIAQKVGLDIKTFTDTLTKDTNEGVLMFLDQLQKMGEADALAALSPLFKDLGMDGVRMAQVLATLATHLDMVKWEQEEANKAFKEASSATREYNIFNNTTQAGIDKAKKRVNELAIELGERLVPVYRHVVTSSGAFLRALNIIVKWIIEFKGTLTVLISSLIAYYGYLLLCKTAQIAWSVAVGAGNAILLAAKAIYLLTAAAIALLTGNTTRAAAAWKLFGQVVKANPIGVVVAALTAAATAIYLLSQKTDEFTQKVKEAITTAISYNKEVLEEQHNLDVLFGKLKGAEKGTKDYEGAKKSIISQYGNYLSGLIDERGEIINLTDAYNRLTEAIRRSAQERGIANARQTINDEYFNQQSEDLKKLQESLEKYGVDARTASEVVSKVAVAVTAGKPIPDDAKAIIERASGNMPFFETFSVGRKETVEHTGPAGIVNRMLTRSAKHNEAMSRLDSMEAGVNPLRQVADYYLKMAIEQLEAIVASGKPGKALKFIDGSNTGIFTDVEPWEAPQFLKQYKEELALRGGTSSVNPSSPTSDVPAPPSPVTNSSSGSSDKFSKEKDWRKSQEALTRIDYATGVINQEQYQNKMSEIEIEFYRKQLLHADLTSTERLEISASMYESQQTLLEEHNASTIEQENRFYSLRKARLQQDYVDGLLSLESYESHLESLETNHLRTIAHLRKQHSGDSQKSYEEFLKADAQYRERLVAQQKKSQQETQRLALQHQQEMKKVQRSIFGLSPAEQKEIFDKSLALLDVVYRHELERAGDNAKRKLAVERAYQAARKRLLQGLADGTITEDPFASSGLPGTDNDPISNWLNSDPGKALVQGYSSVVSGVSSIFSQVTSIINSEAEAQAAAVERSYDRQIAAAEGNGYKVKQLEAKKQREIAKVKNDAQKKAYSMEVIMAIAQTATAAINAYSSAAAIPLIGHVMAPIAAAMATAAGMLQVAAIKKQQQASSAQGYSSGGYTSSAPTDDIPVGVVHSNEWVASAALLRNPDAAQLVRTLDFAQRTNRIGEVGRILSSTSPGNVVNNTVVNNAVDDATMVALASVVADLTRRLNEPFVTINTVTGDNGIKAAQDRYSKLINNKSPR